MFSVESLRVCVGSFALEAFDLTVSKGECHVLLGPSGSGKTTLLRSFLGLLPVQSGTIRLLGRDITALPIESRGFGYVPQHLGLFPHLCVRDNIAYSAKARNVPIDLFQPVVDGLIEATDIRGLLERMPHTLSGGERQRVGLVRALASQPHLLLLDEPFTALHENLRQELWELMRTLQRKHQLTLLLITHDLREAYALADSITVLLGGRVVQQGSKEEVFSRPKTPEVARFLGVENILQGRILKRDALAWLVDIAGIEIPITAYPPPSNTALEQGDVWVVIRSEEILLASAQTPSASDTPLRGTIRSIHPSYPLWKIEIDVGFRIFASVTRHQVEEMGLNVGSSVQIGWKPQNAQLLR